MQVVVHADVAQLLELAILLVGEVEQFAADLLVVLVEERRAPAALVGLARRRAGPGWRWTPVSGLLGGSTHDGGEGAPLVLLAGNPLVNDAYASRGGVHRSRHRGNHARECSEVITHALVRNMGQARAYWPGTFQHVRTY